MRAAVLAVLAVLGLGGCVASSVAGSPVTSSGLPPVETINFDPWAVSDTVVAQLGLEPSTKKQYGEQLKQQGAERGCTWDNAVRNFTVGFDVGRSTRVVQEYADNPTFQEKLRTTIRSRDRLRFTTGNSSINCSLAVQVPGGVVVFTAGTRSVAVNVDPPAACPEVERLAAGIEPLLP